MPEQSSQTVVCVTGVHRSGTSMLAHLLFRCGVELGKNSDMMPAKPDNVDGFWENLKFVTINDGILAESAGGWDLPPKRPIERDCVDNHLQHLVDDAKMLIREFQGFKVWGWKDPRNCLTLPFWSKLLPELTVVLIVRHPAEVALSLTARNGVSRMFGLNLWRTYYEAIFRNLSGHRAIITRYDAFFDDPVREAERILDFLGLPTTDAECARQIVSNEARHHRQSRQDSLSNLPIEISELYRSLITEEILASQKKIADPISAAATTDPAAEWSMQTRRC